LYIHPDVCDYVVSGVQRLQVQMENGRILHTLCGSKHLRIPIQQARRLGLPKKPVKTDEITNLTMLTELYLSNYSKTYIAFLN